MNNESADEPPLSDRIRSWARVKAHAAGFNPFGSDDAKLPTSTLSATPSNTSRPREDDHYSSSTLKSNPDVQSRLENGENTATSQMAGQSRSENPQAGQSVDTQREGEEPPTINSKPKIGIFTRIYNDVKKIILYNIWINWLLVFVPVGIALGALIKAKGDAAPVSPSVVFAINAIAIIPLAGLLSFATESVANKMGDTIGALMNVTFGNAVELIIFIIALSADQISIVQASLVGSILANLLLILGMCFLFGGLRFREQLYNPTVGQMSACLLSLSVISLLLPTAFHFSYNTASQAKADHVVVQVSRGTSVVLLLVYVLYLLFQLKSHAYMYESTPQHLIDEESHPGVLADFMNSSSSSDTSSDSDGDSESSSGSHHTAKRIRRAFRRRRKSSASSKDTSMPSMARTPSSLTTHAIEEIPMTASPSEMTKSNPRELEPVLSGDEADIDVEKRSRRGTQTSLGVTSRDFQSEKASLSDKKKKRKSKKHSKKHQDPEKAEASADAENVNDDAPRSPPRVGFATPPAEELAAEGSPKKPFNLLNLTKPALPKVLSSNVFTQGNGQTLPLPTISNLQAQEGQTLRRTNSLPDRLNRPQPQPRTSGALPVSAKPLPHLMPPMKEASEEGIEEHVDHLSQSTAIVLLLVSTGLVAACAEFLVSSINYLVETSHVSQAFIGLIILPIVGNAAEHVTAVTVASKNKMDLAIGVALGSSIQIALFVTPIIVLLGWCLNTDMSLYFSLFETVSLFASAFIVNYLMIDGRSNYLEGALLIASYVIIAVCAFFYPSCKELNGAAAASCQTGTSG